MTRRKREIVGLRNERDFPHLVELALPLGPFRSVFLEIDAFHRERRIPVATSLGGVRAKALVALWEALPDHASHEGAFDFPDASRSLFDAVAEMTGLTPMVRDIEARLAADVE